MSVSSNRAVCARRLVQEKLCNLLFNHQQKCVTLTTKRNLWTNFPRQSELSPFLRINQQNNKFGSFIRDSQVSLTFSSSMEICLRKNYILKLLLCNVKMERPTFIWEYKKNNKKVVTQNSTIAILHWWQKQKEDLSGLKIIFQWKVKKQ